MKIICNGDGYPQKRLILNVTPNEYLLLSHGFLKIIRKIECKILCGIGRKMLPRLIFFKLYNKLKFECRSLMLDLTCSGLVHSFNAIYKGRCAWCCTIEHTFPATHYLLSGKDYVDYCRKQKKYILSDNCIALMPISKYSESVVRRNLPLFMNSEEIIAISRKIMTLSPPQKILCTIDEVNRKFDDLEKDGLKICFVGREFWRKGGGVLFEALKKVNARRDNKIKFLLISSLSSDGKAYNEDVDVLRNELGSFDWVEYYNELPNETVLNKIKQCHVGALPTYGDTYGFSVLEMQASGVPVITTNTYALPEINNQDRGWMLDMSSIIEVYGKNYFEKKVVEESSKRMIESLESILESIASDTTEVLREKAVKSLDYILNEHSPDDYSKELCKIYNYGLEE